MGVDGVNGSSNGTSYDDSDVLVVIGVQRLHAAWKKRHDAKLMLEWERRLEEMK